MAGETNRAIRGRGLKLVEVGGACEEGGASAEAQTLEVRDRC